MGRGLKMTGNAWLLDTKTNGTAVVLVNQLTLTELVPTKVREQQMQARMEALTAKARTQETPDETDLENLEADSDAMEAMQAMEEMARVPSGEWKDTDLKADVQSLLEYLGKAGGQEDYEFKRSAASLFLFAAHVHSHGLTAEANQIISLLFQKIGDSRKVVGAAMSQIADGEYKKAYREFDKTGNWPQYLAAMEGLLSRFSTAWHDAPLVERVAGTVRKQAGQKSTLTLTGEGWTPEDQQIAALLVQTNLVLSLRHPVFSGLSWLTSDPAASQRPAQRKKKPGPLDLIQLRGGQAIPLLTLMLKDESLVRIQDVAGESYYFSDSDDEAMSAEEVEQRLESFPRPLARGEIARRILEPLVVGRDEDGNRENKPTVDEVAQKSRTWYEQHKTGNRSALLRQLLAEGRQEPLYALMASADPTDHTAVEAYLLNTNKLAENVSYVTHYAQHQGATVRPFIQKYVAELKKLPSLVPKRELAHTSPASLKQREERAKSEVKVLEDLISDKTADQILQEMAASDKKWNPQEMYKAGTALHAKLAQEDPAKALTLLLQTCLKTKDDGLAEFLVQSVSQLKLAQTRKPKTPDVPPPKPFVFKIETHAELWKQVMAQERSGTRQQHWGGDDISCKAQVASAIEMFYADSKEARGNNGMATARFLGARVYEVTIQRAQARLAGKPEAELPRYPDKAKVSQERLTQIGQLLRNSTKENQHELVGQLSLDELLAVPDLVAADSKLNEKLAPGSHLIQNIRLALTNEGLARLCLPLKGKPLVRKSLESLINECKKLAEQGSNVMLMAERRLPLGGVTLHVNGGLQGNMGYSSGRGRGKNQAMVSAMLNAEGADHLNGYVIWPVKLVAVPKAEPKTTGPAKPADEDLLPENAPEMGDYMKKQEEEFWINFEKLFEPARDACQPYSCVLSAKQTNSNEE